jgi:hypothetical protein
MPPSMICRTRNFTLALISAQFAVQLIWELSLLKAYCQVSIQLFLLTQLDVLHTFRITPVQTLDCYIHLIHLIATSRTDNLFQFTPPRMSLVPGTVSERTFSVASPSLSKSTHATLNTLPFLPLPSCSRSKPQASAGSTGLTNYVAQRCA